jgi:hypothetical protein
MAVREYVEPLATEVFGNALKTLARGYDIHRKPDSGSGSGPSLFNGQLRVIIHKIAGIVPTDRGTT